MKHIFKGDRTKLLLGLAFAFTVISSILADRAASLEADMQQKQAPVSGAQPDPTLMHSHDALALTASLRND